MNRSRNQDVAAVSGRRSGAPREGVVLGLRQNTAQFTLLVAVNALACGTLGQERTVLPLLAGQVFHLDLYTSALTYILAFGVRLLAFGVRLLAFGVRLLAFGVRLLAFAVVVKPCLQGS